ncbi:MAG: GTPase, partial [Planctomycetota bacterium]
MRLLTPPGRGGVAVVAAVDAAERRALLACLRTSAGGPVAVESGAAPRRAWLHLDGEGARGIEGEGAAVRDEVLVVDRGARGLEVHLHGSPVLVRALAARFGALEVEALAPAERLLRNARSPQQLQLALEQREVDFAAFLRDLSALPAPQRAAVAAAAIARSRVALALATPLRLVLAGPQNAGKSTLLNRLLFRERALTGAVAGLTRDPVADHTTLDGYPYELVDTAGDGPVAAELDRRAQDRGRALRDGAAVLLVVDGSRPIGPAELPLLRRLGAAALLVVATHAELPSAPWPADLPRHLQTGCGDPGSAPAVREAVGAALRQRRGLPPAGPVGGPAALDDG